MIDKGRRHISRNVQVNPVFINLYIIGLHFTVFIKIQILGL
jgi:hypothetical protein